MYILSSEPPGTYSRNMLNLYWSLFVPKYLTMFLWWKLLSSSISLCMALIFLSWFCCVKDRLVTGTYLTAMTIP